MEGFDTNIDSRPVCRHDGPQLENVDRTTAEAFHAFGRMMHANRLAMVRLSAQSGAHHGEIHALALLCQSEGLTQRELGDILHLSAPRVSIIIDSLETSGAVERRADASDRRLARLHVTAEGRRQERSQRDLLGDYVNRTIGALPERDRQELARLLQGLADRTMEVAREEAEAGVESGSGARE